MSQAQFGALMSATTQQHRFNDKNHDEVAIYNNLSRVILYIDKSLLIPSHAPNGLIISLIFCKVMPDKQAAVVLHGDSQLHSPVVEGNRQIMAFTINIIILFAFIFTAKQKDSPILLIEDTGGKVCRLALPINTCNSLSAQVYALLKTKKTQERRSLFATQS